MNVTVIGGAGRMGRWLTRHFISQGHEVTITTDTRVEEATGFARSVGARFVKENTVAVENADLTVTSTPIQIVPKVLREISSYLKRGSIVAEISSLKSQIVPVLMEISGDDVKPLSVHPLFGPGAQRLEEEKVALIPLVDPSLEVGFVKKMFPGVEVVVVDAEEHDRAMALTLSLSHFINIIFASMISEENLNVLKKLGGTTFTLQLTLSESVMSEDPRLYAPIQMSNEHTIRYLEKFLSKCGMVKEWVSGKDEKRFTEFFRLVQAALAKDEDFAKSYERMYRIREMF